MSRDVKTQQVGQPLQGTVQGFAGANVPNSYVDTFNFMKDVAPNMTPIIEGVMGTARANAFMEGQADRAATSAAVTTSAKLIQEASWVTRDVYAQGVNYQTFTEGQLETQQEIANQAQKSAQSGESIQVFSEKIKPSLAKLNNKLDSLGLTGEARSQAQNQILSYIEAAQKTYQSAVEQETTIRYNTGNAQLGAMAISTITGASTPVDVANALYSLQTQAYSAANSYDPTTADVEAGKVFLSTVKEQLSRTNPANSGDLMRMQAISDYLHGPEANLLDVDARASAIEAINTKRKEVQDLAVYGTNEQLNAIELEYAKTGATNVPALQQLQMSIGHNVAAGLLDPNAGKSLQNKLNSVYTAQVKTMGNLTLATQGSALDRAGVMSESAAADLVLQSTIANNRDTPERAGFIAYQVGVNTDNPVLQKKAMGLVTRDFSTVLENRSYDQIVDAGNNNLNKTYELTQQMYNKYRSTGQLTAANSILQSIPDKKTREALAIIWEDGAVRDLPTTARMFQQEIANLDVVAKSGAMSKIRVQNSDIDDALFGQAFSTTSAQLGYKPSKEVLGYQTLQLNNAVTKHLPKLLSSNARWKDGKGLLRNMQDEGYIVQGRTGLYAVDPSDRLGVGGGEAATTAEMNYVTEAAVDFYIDELGPEVIKSGLLEDSKVGFFDQTLDPENVYTEYKGGQLLVTAYSDSGMKIGDTKMYSYGQLNAMLNTHKQTAGKQGLWDAADVVQNGAGGGTQFKIGKDNGSFQTNAAKVDIQKHLFMYEGYDSSPVPVKTAQGETVRFGNGILMSTATDMLGPDKANRMLELSSTPSNPEYQNLHNEFMDKYFQPIGGLWEDAGLRKLNGNIVAGSRSTGSYSIPTPQHIAVADAMYHGGLGGGKHMVSILNTARESQRKAIEELQQASFYQQAQPSRQNFLLKAVREI